MRVGLNVCRVRLSCHCTDASAAMQAERRLGLRIYDRGTRPATERDRTAMRAARGLSDGAALRGRPASG